MADHWKIYYNYTTLENVRVTGTGYTKSSRVKGFAELFIPQGFTCTPVPAEESHKQQDGGVAMLNGRVPELWLTSGCKLLACDSFPIIRCD